jgi:hypothetical protein
MELILKKSWTVVDASRTDYHDPRTEGKLRSRPETTVSPGTHQIERISNPLGHSEDWLVLVNTKIGQAESDWRLWESPEWGDSQVVIVEE